jgi:hypothetical protein
VAALDENVYILKYYKLKDANEHTSKEEASSFRTFHLSSLASFNFALC